MSSDLYLRPLGRITRPPGLINAAPDKVVRLAEREDVVFAALELIQRHGDGWSRPAHRLARGCARADRAAGPARARVARP